MRGYRYSEWDASQQLFDLDTDQIMGELGRLVSRYGDLSQALRALQRQGRWNNQGRQMPNLDRLLEQLRRMKRSQLDKYDLSSILDEIRQELNEILEMERQGMLRFAPLRTLRGKVRIYRTRMENCLLLLLRLNRIKADSKRNTFPDKCLQRVRSRSCL